VKATKKITSTSWQHAFERKAKMKISASGRNESIPPLACTKTWNAKTQRAEKKPLGNP